jgi:hypothetical protein
VQFVAHARREDIEVGVRIPVGDDSDGECSRVRQRAHTEGFVGDEG